MQSVYHSWISVTTLKYVPGKLINKLPDSQILTDRQNEQESSVVSYKLAFSPCVTKGAGAFLLRISKMALRGNTVKASMSTRVRKYG